MITMPSCFNAGDTIYFPFDAYDSNGASVTISGFAVTDIEVYKDGSTTQRSSDNGYTLLDTDGIDFDGTTGLHGFSIDTSDNSDSGFWADGHTYWVNVNAITIDGQTVRFTYLLALGFSLRPATAGRKLVVDSAGLADANAVKVGPSGSGTAQTAGDICGKLGTPSNLGGGATIAANLADIESQTDDIGAAGAGLTAIASVGAVAGNVGGSVLGDVGGDLIGSVNGNVDGQVAGLAAGAVTAASIAAGAITNAKFAANAIDAAALAPDAVTEIQSGLSTLNAAGVRSAIGLASANLDTKFSDLQTHGDANWGASGAAPQVLVDTTVANVVDQTHFELTAALGANDTYNNMTVVFYDASASNTPSVRKITDFADASNVITIDSAPDFTVANGDGVKIFVTPPGTTAPTAAENAAELLNTVNTSSNDATKVGGQLRRTHAGIGGTKHTQDAAETDAPIHVLDEAGTAELFKITQTNAGTESTWTPS